MNLKKTAGTILFTLCAFVLIIAAFALINYISITSTSNQAGLYSFIIPYFLVIALIAGTGAYFGWKIMRKKLPINIIPYHKELDIHITVQMELKEYRSLGYRMLFQRLSLVLTVAFSLIIFSILIDIDDYRNVFQNFIFIPVILLILFSLTHYRARKIFNTNKYLNEPIEYIFNNQSVYLKGRH